MDGFRIIFCSFSFSPAAKYTLAREQAAQAQELGLVPSGGWSVLSLNQNHLCKMTGRHKKVPEPQNSSFGFGFLATKE